MKGKLKNKLIMGIVIILVLSMAWMMGGNPSKEIVSSPYQTESQTEAKEELSNKSAPSSIKQGDNQIDSEEDNLGIKEDSVAEKSQDTKVEESDLITSEVDEEKVQKEKVQEDSVSSASKEVDEYMTYPVPEGKPAPVEPQDTKINKEQSFKVSLSVSCKTILNNMDLLDKNKHELVPEDGILFPLTEVVAYEGESVFDVLLREMQKAKIHMEFVNTPMYNSAYIEGIHNLYEFDTGELSGWMYKVNGWFPNYGCSRYQLQAGDLVEWVYTCDLGRDVGKTNLEGQ